MTATSRIARLFVDQTFDFAFFQRLDETVFGREIDNLGARVAEVEFVEEIICCKRCRREHPWLLNAKGGKLTKTAHRILVDTLRNPSLPSRLALDIPL